jgi:predicted membrane channel-forming protein YqfA (hemolysin III family)
MFIGHYALGFAAKRLAPRTSLGTLFVAPTLADLLWPVLLLLGVEHAHVVPGTNPFLTLWLDDYPYSHSLFALIVWGALFGSLYKAKSGDKRAALVIGLLVVSHWVLDFVTHRPDIQLYPGGAKLGLGLWNSPAATVIVESVMLLAGVAMYLRATRARDGIGQWGLWGLVVLLAGSYVSTLFTPTPTDVRALAIGGIFFEGVFVLVAWWVDRHRDVTSNHPALL